MTEDALAGNWQNPIELRRLLRFWLAYTPPIVTDRPEEKKP